MALAPGARLGPYEITALIGEGGMGKVWRAHHAIPIPPRAYSAARLSPDGTRVALEARDENTDIWVWHLVRQTLTRLTFAPEANFGHVWSPDGQRVAFSRGMDGENLYWQSADGTGTPERLTQRSFGQRPTAFAPDLRSLLFQEPPIGVQDIGIVTLSGDRKSELILHTPFDEENAEISPDGRWLAYQSNESGRVEIKAAPGEAAPPPQLLVVQHFDEELKRLVPLR